MTYGCHAGTNEEDSRLVAAFFHASGLDAFLRMTAAVAHRKSAIRTASVKGSMGAASLTSD